MPSSSKKTKVYNIVEDYAGSNLGQSSGHEARVGECDPNGLSSTATASTPADSQHTGPTTRYLIQYRITNMDLEDLSGKQRDEITKSMHELFSLTLGISRQDVQIKLSQGSLVIDAAVEVPEEDGEPTMPMNRAVQRIMTNVTGVDPTFGDPRVM